MTNPDLARPLAAALADKGYASLTSVQQAVLAPEAAGADLLVSAQTGSGKTVAIGLAMAPELLGGQDVLPEGGSALALVIAPTRELAQQVALELGWLYQKAGARIATCVGGMDFRTERRALERGAQIVVGTPGRLRDHIERGSLDLSSLAVAVLDEADEMLDLGFREDLEFILESAPADRRTLMFSATVPPGIAALAQDFQRDALRISAAGESRQHGDIEYRALSVLPRDRDHAIFNLLRFYEARTAIIFCKTRAEVNRLLARMGNRGFRAVALSGELTQQERMHALQAVRDGRARVCIATDVAARGIDLPGLELVIHADLPTNPETLLHRSGRTGRAGAKGVSALIVTSPEFKRAQSLLRRARVVAEWGKAPTADEVRGRDDLRMRDLLGGFKADEDDQALAEQLLAEFSPAHLASAFIHLFREGHPAPEELADVDQPGQTPARPRGEFGPSVWFLLSVGYTGRAEARWLLPKLCDAAGITRDAIGAIRVKTNETFVQIAAASADRFIGVTDLDEGIRIRRLDDEPVFEPSPRGERPNSRPPRDFAGAKSERPRKFSAPAEQTDDAEKPRKARWGATERAQRPVPKAAPKAASKGAKGPKAKFERDGAKFGGKPTGAKPHRKGPKPRG